jgi:hypothetical protein
MFLSSDLVLSKLVVLLDKFLSKASLNHHFQVSLFLLSSYSTLSSEGPLNIQHKSQFCRPVKLKLNGLCISIDRRD